MAKGKKTGGRVAGVPNKLTLDLKEALRPCVVETIKELSRLAKSADNEAVRLKAIELVHDRFFGKVSQSIDMTVRRPSEMTDDELAAATANAEDALRAFGGLPSDLPSGTGETQH